MLVMYQKRSGPNYGKDLINIVSVTLEGLRMFLIELSILDFSSNFTGPDL